MPEPAHRSDPVPLPSPQQQRVDRALLASVLLCPLAVGINTIVGYGGALGMRCESQYNKLPRSIVDFCLCGIAAALALWSSRQLAPADETTPNLERRRFIVKMGLGPFCLGAIVVLAGTLAMFIMASCD
ncbi:hypothetical protein [Terriglobus sp.]|uniref:hypothetical protein n=1 Tax=Terriglobus sp. TaxID=1889013 RepID=UPI003AFFCEE0